MDRAQMDLLAGAVNIWNVFELRGQANNTTINCGGQYYQYQTKYNVVSSIWSADVVGGNLAVRGWVCRGSASHAPTFNNNKPWMAGDDGAGAWW